LPEKTVTARVPSISGSHRKFLKVPTQRNSYTATLATFLLVEGVWGLFSPVVFGYLTTNTVHAVIHILLGIAGIWCAFHEYARSYLFMVGLLLLLVGLAWFEPSMTALITQILNVNNAVAWLNIVVGGLSLIMAFGKNSEAHKGI
jgi:hypothetical protein